MADELTTRAAKGKKGGKGKAAKASGRTGRPMLYSQALVKKIGLRLINGESLRKICADPKMPCIATIWNWYRNPKVKEDFLKQLLGARAFQSLVMDGDLQEIADDSSRDYKTVERDGQSVEVVDQEHIQRSKLRCEVMWKRMRSMNPAMFGDKMDVNHGGKVEVAGLDEQIEAARKRLEKARKDDG